MTKVTGWDNGLSQDYDKGLGRWFANRLGARQQLRQDFEMTQVLIDRATLEQLVTALEAVLDDSKYANELTVTGGVYEGLQCKEALTAGRAAIANAEPTGWIAVSDRLPLEADGEVLARMRDGRPEIAWATYWHGANTGFAQWTFRDHDEYETPTHWMPLPAAPKEQQ